MISYRAPWDSDPAPPAPAVRSYPVKPASKPLGRRPAASHAPLAGTSPGWLYHHLTVSGPAEALESLVGAARGSGIVPWRRDYETIEEDVFNLAIAVPPARRSLSLDGCRILARQFRARVEAHDARAAALAEHSRACPFDLHALLPAPSVVLQLGPADPAALAWLSQHWGVTGRLRHVVRRQDATAGRRLPAGHGVASYGFFTDGETPHAAVRQLGQRWPALRFVLQPRPAD